MKNSLLYSSFRVLLLATALLVTGIHLHLLNSEASFSHAFLSQSVDEKFEHYDVVHLTPLSIKKTTKSPQTILNGWKIVYSSPSLHSSRLSFVNRPDSSDSSHSILNARGPPIV